MRWFKPCLGRRQSENDAGITLCDVLKQERAELGFLHFFLMQSWAFGRLRPDGCSFALAKKVRNRLQIGRKRCIFAVEISTI